MQVMLPKLTTSENDLGRDVRRALPQAGEVVGIQGMPHDHVAIWDRAVRYLDTRGNDGHTVYAYGLARALVDLHPEADAEVVLPAILLHDTGWSRVAPEKVLAAIEPGAARPDLVLLHEKEGARIATEILNDLGRDESRTAEIATIIDGHDSRREALSLNDSLVKDADKLWRLTPHGVDLVMDWFGLDREEAHRLIGSRVHAHLFTQAARNMARGFAAVASIDCLPQRIALGR